MRADCKGKPQCKAIFTMFARCKEGFPSGEAGALATDEGGSICTYERYTLFLRIPPTKRARQPHPAQNPHLPDKQKTSPMFPPLLKSKTNFRFVSGGNMGEVLGERERFGGREPPLQKRGLSPSEVFPCASRPQNVREAALYNKSAPPRQTKNFPTKPRHCKKRNKLSLM